MSRFKLIQKKSTIKIACFNPWFKLLMHNLSLQSPIIPFTMLCLSLSSPLQGPLRPLLIPSCVTKFLSFATPKSPLHSQSLLSRGRSTIYIRPAAVQVDSSLLIPPTLSPSGTCPPSSHLVTQPPSAPISFPANSMNHLKY